MKPLLCIYNFSSPGPMVPVRYCCHFASIVIISVVIVCQLFTFINSSLYLHFFHLHVLAQKPNFGKKILFIQTNSFIIFTCQNPVLLVPSFGQVGQCKDCCSSQATVQIETKISRNVTLMVLYHSLWYLFLPEIQHG